MDPNSLTFSNVSDEEGTENPYAQVINKGKEEKKDTTTTTTPTIQKSQPAKS